MQGFIEKRARSIEWAGHGQITESSNNGIFLWRTGYGKSPCIGEITDERGLFSFSVPVICHTALLYLHMVHASDRFYAARLSPDGAKCIFGLYEFLLWNIIYIVSEAAKQLTIKDRLIGCNYDNRVREAVPKIFLFSKCIHILIWFKRNELNLHESTPGFSMAGWRYLLTGLRRTE